MASVSQCIPEAFFHDNPIQRYRNPLFLLFFYILSLKLIRDKKEWHK
jgi:hypothetical protein